MAFDFYDEHYRLSLWRGLPIQSQTVAVKDLRNALPFFDLRPFGIPPNTNERMRCIVRMPYRDDPYERPVAVVSDQYELLQHQVMATWLQSNLTEAGLSEAKATVDMTEYGERLRIIVPLDDIRFSLNDDLLTPDAFSPEIEVMNSVDRSSAFTVVLRWRRLICSNGMFTVEEDRMRSVHRVDLSRTHLVRDFMADRLGSNPDIFATLRKWQKTKVDMLKVKDWVSGWLRDKSGWTVENCARMWAILETGFDGAVTPPREKFERHPLSAYRVGQHKKVMGIGYPITTAYEVSQILTWITSNQRSVEFQTEGTEDVPRLMGSLLQK